MNKNNIKQWFIFKGCAVFVMALSIGYIYSVCGLMEKHNTKSFFIQSDIIEYNGKVIQCVGTFPMFVWGFFFGLKLLLKKDIGPLKKSTTIGTFWGVFSLGTFILGFIVSFIIPFILMLSPYTSCDVGTRDSYYAIRPELCETIIVDHGLKKKKPDEESNIN